MESFQRAWNDISRSRIVQGCWKLTDWNLSAPELLEHIHQLAGIGITSFDHADIYGDYRCEKLFGDALKLDPGFRYHIRLISKCGIKLLSDKYPERKIKSYDYSATHIISSVEQSLVNFRTDHIDLLLLHRPAPFFNPEEVAEAFESLEKQGKVLAFGVSNFLPSQFEMLEAYTPMSLVTNQVEISPYCLEHFNNGNMDFFLKKKIFPMAWSPLARGILINPDDERSFRINQILLEIAQETGADDIDILVYSWLLSHPAGIIPVTGSRKIERVRRALDAIHFPLTQEQWYRIYNASTGRDLP